MLPLLNGVLGFLAWVAVSKLTGRREAWDAGEYFTLALPVLALAAFASARFSPEKNWRYGLAQGAGQFAAMLFLQRELGSLFPLGLAAFAILSLPSILAARLGARSITRPQSGS